MAGAVDTTLRIIEQAQRRDAKCDAPEAAAIAGISVRITRWYNLTRIARAPR